MININYIH